MNEIDVLESPSGLTIYHKGPSLEKGPMSSLFYFSLSGDESLNLDPYNQPVAHLSDKGIRIFSFTLPFHGPGFNPKIAVDLWRKEILQGNDVLTPFFEQCLANINFLISEGYVDASKIAMAGLSRGAFIATHLAAKEPKIGIVLGFAPMTTLALETPETHVLDLVNITDQLVQKKLRYYIGNRDVQVGTEKCFAFVMKVAEAQFESGVRSPQVELFVTPSIGLKGHGTAPHIFQNGAKWLDSELSS